MTNPLENNQFDLGALARDLLKENGGLAGLKQKFTQAGLGDAIQSWIGTGENGAVDESQIHHALGDETLKNLTEKTHLDISKLLPLLATALPKIIDKLTPDGDEDGADARAADASNLQGMLGNLLKGGLGKLLG